MDNLKKILESKFDYSPFRQRAVEHLKEVIKNTPTKLYHDGEKPILKLEFEFPIAEYVLLPSDITEGLLKQYSFKKEKYANDCYKIMLLNG